MKIHPQHCTSSNNNNPSTNNNIITKSNTNNTSSTREVFTLWMKSLILGGKGCTVYDSKGRVVYRVDNYGSKCCTKVFLMDCHGDVLLTIHRKKFWLLPRWAGYKEEKKKGESWLFHVRKCWKMTKMSLEREVVVSLDHDKKSTVFKIEKGKTDISSSCRIVDRLGGLVAEMKRKQSGGVVLGEDVLTLVVEANVDHSLIMGLMVAYSLINSTI